MINLEVFFKNHFDTTFISDDNLRKFADIHLQRLTTNNPGGIYTALITDTGTVYTAYFGAIGDEAVRTAVKEGMTVELNTAIENFKHDVSQKEGIVRGIYGVDTGTYQEFFPQGLTAYSNADLGNIHTFTEIMMDAATAHAADVGADFVTLFTDHHNDILAKREAQLELMGEVEGKKDITETTRDEVEVQLMKNLLTIAVNNIGNLSAVNTYFDQSFIRRGGPGEEDVYTGTVAENVTHSIIEMPWSDDPEIELSNIGTTDLMFCLSPTEGTACTAGVTVTPGTTQTVNASELGDISYTFLNVTNLSSDTEGEYSVTI